MSLFSKAEAKSIIEMLTSWDRDAVYLGEALFNDSAVLRTHESEFMEGFMKLPESPFTYENYIIEFIHKYTEK